MFKRIILIKYSFNVECFWGEQFNSRTLNGFSSSGSEQTIRFSNPGYNLSNKTINGKQYLNQKLLASGSKSDRGEPDLPTLTTFYAVAPGKTINASVQILESEVLNNVEIAPFDTWENEPSAIIKEGDAYGQNLPFPQQLVSVSEPMVIRDAVVVQISLTPFQYNPVTKDLVVIQNAEISLIEIDANSVPFIPQKRSRDFEAIYESLIVNYSSSSRDDVQYQKPSILYVLPNNIGDLFGTIETLMEWKKRVGYEVNYVSSSNIVNNRNNLKGVY